MRPRLEILAPPLIERIVGEAMAVLERTGVAIDDAPARSRLAALGLVTDTADERVRFPSHLLERAIASTPSAIALHGRDGGLHATLAGERSHFVPGSSALRVLDRVSGQPREATSADFIEYVRLACGLRHIDYLSTAFVPQDVPADLADAWRLYLVLAHSQSPVVTGAFSASGVPRMAEMLALFRRDRADLRQRPLAIFTCCPTTPLRWSSDALCNLVDCAEWGIPVEIVPVLLLGMIAPVTPVGALVLHTAEVLSGLAIAQLVRPGTPVLFGGAPAAFHMQSMTNPMSAVEALQVDCGYAAIARHLGLPSQAYMALSDAKWNDPQAGMETGVGAFLATLAGIDSVSGAGMLDYVNCFSLEKLVFDDEIIGHAQRFVRPLAVQDDLPTGALIDELLRDGHLLMSEHTLQHWPQALYLPGPLADRTGWEQWRDQGSRDWRQRACQAVDETLASYALPPLDPPLHREIQQLLLRTADQPRTPLPAFAESW